MTTWSDLRLLSSIAHVIEDNDGRPRPFMDQAADIVGQLAEAGYAIVPASRPRAELADQLRSAVRELELAVDTASYWDGLNGTRERHEAARAVVAALIDEVTHTDREGSPCST
ncbi:hypothetical protein JNUCC0626_18385 [Lentzea sp. JNUCC 0626]|uniref:hypothetical protein n=1 Tax=Lentzea sp. JNUCC 0626 TaxID=3367513 RepID=UPI0037489461